MNKVCELGAILFIAAQFKLFKFVNSKKKKIISSLTELSLYMYMHKFASNQLIFSPN